MEHVYLKTVQAAAANVKTLNKEKPPPPNGKIAQLEAELRGDLMDTKTATTNQTADTASRPTPTQAGLIQKYDPQDMNLKQAGNAVGDYSIQLKQTQDDYQHVSMPFLLSTLTSQGDAQKMAGDYMADAMLYSQYGHQQAQRKGFKNAMRTSKLSSTDTWI